MTLQTRCAMNHETRARVLSLHSGQCILVHLLFQLISSIPIKFSIKIVYKMKITKIKKRQSERRLKFIPCMMQHAMEDTNGNDFLKKLLSDNDNLNLFNLVHGDNRSTSNSSEELDIDNITIADCCSSARNMSARCIKTEGSIQESDNQFVKLESDSQTSIDVVGVEASSIQDLPTVNEWHRKVHLWLGKELN